MAGRAAPQRGAARGDLRGPRLELVQVGDGDGDVGLHVPPVADVGGLQAAGVQVAQEPPGQGVVDGGGDGDGRDQLDDADRVDGLGDGLG